MSFIFKIKINYLIIFLLMHTLLFSAQIELTTKEKEFLKKHPNIVLGSDSSWIPYIIKTDANSTIGFDNSILEKVNELTGANFRIIAGKWEDMVQKAIKKEIDGLSTSAIHKEREKYFNFSTPYTSSNRVLIISNSNPKNIQSIDDLEGKTIVVQDGNLFDEKIAKNIKNAKIKKAKNYDELIEILITQDADATIANETFNYYIDKNRLSYTKIVDIFEEPKLDLVFSIRKDWPEALTILNKGLLAITDKEKHDIKAEWFQSVSLLKKGKKVSIDESVKTLTNEELQFIANKKNITMCIDPDWMPFEKNENGKHIGMSADYFDLIEKRLNINVEMIPTKTWLESLEFGKKRVCDIFSLVMSTKEREEYLNFTKPYLEIPLVLATKTEELFVNDITKIRDKKMGIVKGYAYGVILREKYPELDLIDVENINDGLKKVSNDELYGFIGALSTVGYHIQKKYIGQLKIAGKFDEKWSLGIGVRNDIPIMTTIFNKAISSISKEEHQEILNKWLSVKYDKVTYKYLFEILAIAILIILVILFINRRLSLEIKKRKKVENYLNLIIKGANLGTWTWDPQTNTNIINENWAKIIGYTKEEVDKTDNVFDFIFEEDIHLIEEALKTHQEGKSEIFEAQFRMKAKDGSTKWIYSCGSVVQRDIHTDNILMAGIHQDITDRKELESELKKQNTYIIQQSRQAAMGEMLENIAHQWRQPLSTITTAASGVKIRKEFNSLDDESLNESMVQIIKSGTYLSDTIEDFRNFFRKDKVETQFEISELFDKSLQFFKSKIINRNIKIIKNIEDKTISSYENELIQALMNIFNNAIDALENNQEERLIFIEEHSNEEYITITIKDNAGGIKESIIYKIFDPYFTTKHQSQGTGIGLHMTREIIVKHLNGTIEASNHNFNFKDKNYFGALFTIRLPKR